ncbi:MAG: hypothetical protein WA395_06730 [Nitrososphaeraceae archaeon]
MGSLGRPENRYMVGGAYKQAFYLSISLVAGAFTVIARSANRAVYWFRPFRLKEIFG